MSVNHDTIGLIEASGSTGDVFQKIYEAATATNYIYSVSGGITFEQCELAGCFIDNAINLDFRGGTFNYSRATSSQLSIVGNLSNSQWTNGTGITDFTNQVCVPMDAFTTTNLYHSGNWYYLNPSIGDGYVGAFTGNGSGLTNLNATQITGTLPPANLPGITTNVSMSGVTFYITNGVIMRISSP